MANIEMLIPKRQLPEWIPNVEPTSIQTVAMATIPLLGTVSAGHPIDLYSHEDRVEIPASMVKKETYALRVKGDSMIDENIQDGDIVVINRRETAENGQSVVVLINGEQTTLKRFFIEPNGIRLQPANKALKSLFLAHDQVQILGIVTAIIRTPNA